MQVVNAIVLPGLAGLVLIGTAVMALLIFTTPKVKKVRPPEPSVALAEKRRKHVL